MMPSPAETDARAIGDRCPFCHLAANSVWMRGETSVAIWDAYPVSEGHALVVPSRHVASFYELTSADQHNLWKLVAEVRQHLVARFAPDGFNIGLNDGAASGQTIGHAHIHVIPRRKGDVADPRGGIRWVIAAKAPYWKRP